MSNDADKVWVVGTAYEDSWEAMGIYWTEQDATRAADYDEFIALVTVGKSIPTDVREAEKLYFPHYETWETSKLYMMRRKMS